MQTFKLELTAAEIIIIQEALYALECNSTTFDDEVGNVTCKFEKLIEQLIEQIIMTPNMDRRWRAKNH